MQVHRLGLRLGMRIVPDHYYSPVASIDELEKTRNRWTKRSPLTGLDIDLDAQTDNLRSICLPFANEYADNRVYREAVEKKLGPGYGPIEAQALHGVLRRFRPRLVIEIGSGVSTSCIQHALSLNHAEDGREAQHTCIDPFPSAHLRAKDGFQGVTLIDEPVQDIDPAVFDALGENDLLFVDSSHAVRPDGDANHIILEILPRLAGEVMVHFHDVFLPYDHPPHTLRLPFHWMETALLRAYMTHNDRIEIVFCMSMLHHDRPEALKACFADYDPADLPGGLLPDDAPDLSPTSKHFPSSIYLRIKHTNRDHPHDA